MTWHVHCAAKYQQRTRNNIQDLCPKEDPIGFHVVQTNRDNKSREPQYHMLLLWQVIQVAEALDAPMEKLSTAQLCPATYVKQCSLKRYPQISTCQECQFNTQVSMSDLDLFTHQSCLFYYSVHEPCLELCSKSKAAALTSEAYFRNCVEPPPSTFGSKATRLWGHSWLWLTSSKHVWTWVWSK